MLRVKGVRVAFVSFSEFLPGNVSAKGNKTQLAFASEEAVRRAVGAARRQADVVVASFHWGAEYASRPRDSQKKLAGAAIESGADLVLGHHPHVLEGLQARVVRRGETERRALVIYSLGNFVFDSPPMLNQSPLESVILRCTLSKEGIETVELLPVSIEARRPRAADALKAKKILARLALLSAELDTELTDGKLNLQKGNSQSSFDRHE